MTSQPTMCDHVVGQSTINKYPFYVSYLTSVGLSISCFIGLQGKKKDMVHIMGRIQVHFGDLLFKV